MIGAWTAFAIALFVLEPLLLQSLFRRYVTMNKDRAFAVALHLHVIALAVSALAIVAGVLGAYGVL